MMVVQDIMQRGVVVVGPKQRLVDLMPLMKGRGIRHLPVVDHGNLVGIISDRDLKAAVASLLTSAGGPDLNAVVERLTAADVMTRKVVTVAPMFSVEEAAKLMVTNKISALPVTEAGRLVGIITETDVLHLFIRALGITEPSSRIDVVLGDEPRALARAIELVEGAGTTICSVMTLRSPVTGLTQAVIRVTTINPGAAIKALEAHGFMVRDSWRG
jgi:acetoin utilization protein AcuB